MNFWFGRSGAAAAGSDQLIWRAEEGGVENGVRHCVAQRTIVASGICGPSKDTYIHTPTK
jgi:hypothetical protein